MISKTLKFLAAGLLFATALCSCVSTKNVALSPSDRAAMRGKTVIASQREMPSFGVLTPGKMAAAGLTGPIGGAIAGGMAESEGKKLLQKYRVAVPEETVMKPLLKSLTSRTGARALPESSTKVTGGDPKEIARAYPQADYILDVRTTGWMGGYYAFALSKYFIVYGTKMLLIERSSGRVVAEGFHSYRSDDRENAPDYDGIFANDAAFLKAETKKGTDGAIQHFSGLF